jgi:chorismate mutase
MVPIVCKIKNQKNAIFSRTIKTKYFDNIDNQILDLLNQRMDFVQQIRDFKKQNSDRNRRTRRTTKFKKK